MGNYYTMGNDRRKLKAGKFIGANFTASFSAATSISVFSWLCHKQVLLYSRQMSSFNTPPVKPRNFLLPVTEGFRRREPMVPPTPSPVCRISTPRRSEEEEEEDDEGQERSAKRIKRLRCIRRLSFSSPSWGGARNPMPVTPASTRVVKMLAFVTVLQQPLSFPDVEWPSATPPPALSLSPLHDNFCLDS